MNLLAIILASVAATAMAATLLMRQENKTDQMENTYLFRFYDRADGRLLGKTATTNSNAKKIAKDLCLENNCEVQITAYNKEMYRWEELNIMRTNPMTGEVEEECHWNEELSKKYTL